jgi:hypothetical protein
MIETNFAVRVHHPVDAIVTNGDVVPFGSRADA